MHNNDENSDDPRPLSAEPVDDPTSNDPTSNDPTSNDPTVDDEVIATMVRDAGGGAELGIVLAQIRGLGSPPAPAPSAELAALLANGLPPTARSTRRTSLRHRAFLGTILVAAMGATAVGAAVADDSFRQGAQVAISNLINTLSPFRPPAPAPTQPVGHPRPSPEPTVPGQTVPGLTAPVTKSGDSEHADRIPGQTETGQTETRQTEPSSPETSRIEPSTPETSTPETSTPEASTLEPSKPATGQVSPPKDAPDSTSDPVPSAGAEGTSTKPPETG